MFEHSVKVPRLYKTAARIAQQVKENGLSLKQLVYEKKHPNVKAIYALVLSTLQNEDSLDYVLKQTGILANEKRLDLWLARILITELLWGKKTLPGKSKPVMTVLSYKEKLFENSIPVKKNEKAKKKVVKPKYVRVNTLKITVEEVVKTFRNDGWSLIRCGDGSDYAAFLATLSALSEDQFMIDVHITDLLIFPPRTQLYDHNLFRNGCVFIQDKASCFPVSLLNPDVGSTVLDMCAAPGMKSIQLAAMVGRSGKVFAIERDEKRYESLKKIVEAADASNTTTINQDALSLNPQDYQDVAYITVDPSCTGSGMLDRIEIENSFYKQSENRVEKLASFQMKLLKHALFHFKDVKRVVYSTCSTFSRENEEVIKEVAAQVRDFRLVRLDEVFKGRWFNFGAESFGTIGRSCLYCKPEVDRTNGFFVALFERLKEGEVNEYYDRDFDLKWRSDRRNENVESLEIKEERNCSDVEATEEKSCRNEIEEKTVGNVAEKYGAAMKKKQKNDQFPCERFDEPKKKKHKRKDSDDSPSKVDYEHEEKYGAAMKKKKHKNDQLSHEDIESQECFDESKKKKHKKKNRDNKNEENIEEEEEYGAAMKKKKQKNVKTKECFDEPKKKKHKKKHNDDSSSNSYDEHEEKYGAAIKKKKHKKNDDSSSKIVDEHEENIEYDAAMKKNKQKNKQFSHENQECFDEPKKKKHKKKDSDNSSSKIDDKRDENIEYDTAMKKKKQKYKQFSHEDLESRKCFDEPKKKKHR